MTNVIFGQKEKFSTFIVYFDSFTMPDLYLVNLC